MDAEIVPRYVRWVFECRKLIQLDKREF